MRFVRVGLLGPRRVGVSGAAVLVAAVLVAAVLAVAVPVAAGSAGAASPGAAAEVAVTPHRGVRDRIERWTLETRVDFGDLKDKQPASVATDGTAPSPYAGWCAGMVRVARRPDETTSWLRELIEGEDATLLLPMRPGATRRIVLTLGDPARERGPLSVIADGELVVGDLTTAAGEIVDVAFTVTPATDRLRVRLAGDGCATFAVAGVSSYTLTRERGAQPPKFSRPVTFADSASVAVGLDSPKRAREALRRACDFLVAGEPVDGVLAQTGNWYESSFPVRALLAGGAILHRPDFRREALACTDRFRRAQGDDGGWASSTFGREACAESVSAPGHSRNLADVGSMALALSVAAASRGGRGETLDRAAARRFADRMVLPNQLPSGAFPNLRYEGKDYRHPYSVATGVEAANLSALYAATGERGYLDAATRAALYLADNVRSDGAILFHPHDVDTVRVIGRDRLGDLYYVLEGMLWTAHYADEPARGAIGAALDRVLGEDAVGATAASPATWIGAGSEWENSKRAGLLAHLVVYRELRGHRPGLDAWIDDLAAALEDSATATTAGVGVELGMPGSKYALVATGFAGLGLAARLDPAVIFPRARDARRPHTPRAPVWSGPRRRSVRRG